MTTTWGPVEIHEIPWTVIAFIGSVLWFRNMLEARKDLLAARQLLIGNGRLLWAKFSQLLTGSMFFIELLFMLGGAVSIFRVSPGNLASPSRLLIVYSLIVATIVFTFVAYRWDRTNAGIRKILEQRDLATPPQTKS